MSNNKSDHWRMDPDGLVLERNMNRDNPWDLSCGVKVKPSRVGSPPKSTMTMDEVREIDRKKREAFLEEWAPIIEVMES